VDIKSKNVLIVGATGGMGGVIAARMAKMGVSRLFLVSNDRDGLNKLSAELNVENKTYVCDLSNRASINDFLLEFGDDCEDLDVLINAAGVGIYKNLSDMNDKDWDLSIAINLTAVQMMTRGVIKQLENGGGGVVVSLGSGAGKMPMAGRSVYCVTKFGLRGWSLSLSEEYKDKNVKFILMTLGSVMTDFGPLGIAVKESQQGSGDKQYLRPDQVAGKIIETMSKDKPEMEVEFYPEGYLEEWRS
jgi:uncharacterized protein